MSSRLLVDRNKTCTARQMAREKTKSMKLDRKPQKSSDDAIGKAEQRPEVAIKGDVRE